jgi:hypothetical protein
MSTHYFGIHYNLNRCYLMEKCHLTLKIILKNVKTLLDIPKIEKRCYLMYVETSYDVHDNVKQCNLTLFYICDNHHKNVKTLFDIHENVRDVIWRS